MRAALALLILLTSWLFFAFVLGILVHLGVDIFSAGWDLVA